MRDLPLPLREVPNGLRDRNVHLRGEVSQTPREAVALEADGQQQQTRFVHGAGVRWEREAGEKDAVLRGEEDEPTSVLWDSVVGGLQDSCADLVSAEGLRGPAPRIADADAPHGYQATVQDLEQPTGESFG